jgi:hypothetical protein
VAKRYLIEARDKSQLRLDAVRARLQGAEALITEKACVYATGSFGRLEAGPESDLDLFILDATDGSTDKGLLDGLAEIKLKYFLIHAVESEGIPDFDGDGKFLKVHTVDDFVRKLGSPEDDYENTLTGRLLLVLESRPLLGEALYLEAVRKTVSAYFVDFEDNRERFIPAFLINDIMRMWRTFCVNYEYYRKKSTLKSKLKHLKLKYSRMLSCYSAVIYLLSLFEKNRTVAPDDVVAMIGLTPVERLEAVGAASFWEEGSIPDGLSALVEDALDLYSDFLQLVHKPKQEVEQEYLDNQKEWLSRSHRFGEKLANIIDAISHSRVEESNLYRYILI